MEETERLRVCRKCLLEDMADEMDLANAIRERIALMPEDEKAEPAAVQFRLAQCRQCDRLVNGMCGLCGCYVELRSVKKHMRCPDIPKKW